ncbi:MAG: hypothetical protein HHJ09_11750 [Glaciimonas sp.]|nr:hypothetical protein [Glaciimonas sp.]
MQVILKWMGKYLVLQNELGYSSLSMTMEHAHQLAIHLRQRAEPIFESGARRGNVAVARLLEPIKLQVAHHAKPTLRRAAIADLQP